MDLHVSERCASAARSRFAGLVVGCALSSLGSMASAQPLDRAGMVSARDDYFSQERTLGLGGMLVGTTSLGGAAILYFQDNDFLEGASYPLAGFGLLELVAGGMVFFRTPGQLSDLKTDLDRDPTRMRRDELDRMKRVNGQFDVLTIVWIVGIAAGAGTLAYGFIDESDTAKGVGAGVMLHSSILLTGDLIAAGSAKDYTRALERFQPTAATSASGATLGVRGAF